MTQLGNKLIKRLLRGDYFVGKRCSAEDSTDTLRWGWITVAGDTESVEDWILVCERKEIRWGWSFSCNLLGIILLDSCGDKSLSSARNDPLNLVGEVYCTPLGINFQSLLGMIPPLRWGSFFRPCWENIDSTGGILYAVGDHSYTLLRNVKTAGDTLIFAGEYSLYSAGEYSLYSTGEY